MKNRDDKIFEKVLKEHLDRMPPGQESPCPDENLVSAYLEGSLPADLKKRFENHAAGCSRCREEMALWLKIQEAALESKNSAELEQKRAWSLADGWAWMQQLSYKPVLALLVIAVISSYLGLREVRQNEILKEQEAKSVSSLSEFKTQPAEAQTVAAESAAGSEKSKTDLRVDRSLSASYRSQSTLKDKKNSVDKLEISTQPSALPPEEPSRKATTDGSANLVLSKDESRGKLAEQRLPVSVPMARQEEEQKVMAPTLIGGIAVVSSAPSKQQDYAKPALVAAENLPEKTHSMAEKGKKEMAAAMESDAAQLPASRGTSQRLVAQDKNETLLPKAEKGRRVVGSKQFEFRNGLWTDLAISSPIVQKALIIYRDSPQALALMAQWPEYRSIFEEKEDLLIQLDENTYLFKAGSSSP